MADVTTRLAACACGQLTARCTGAPVRVSVCHCLACKRRTGSAFSWNARFQAAAVAVAGRQAEFTREGDEGGRLTYNFCPDCGATVHYRIDTDPGVVAVPAGAFADPAFPAPFVSVYERRRCDWVGMSASPLRREA